MKERGILFSAPMVKAILDGSKTQTRRVVKPDRRHDITNEHGYVWPVWYETGQKVGCPYGITGDRLWVRETWMPYIPSSGDWDNPSDPGIFEPGKGQIPHECDVTDGPVCIAYKADMTDPGEGWFPSIHMPRWASRITLEVVSVRVERLQDISPDDCAREGIETIPGALNIGNPYAVTNARARVDRFRELWERINGEGSWAQNSFVWVIEFKRLEPTP